MSEERIKSWNVSDEVLFNCADKRYQEGDYIGALTMLNKRSRIFPPNADAFAMYADIYEQLGLYEMAADAWFRFLDVCHEDDFGEAYEGLSVCFMNMDDDIQASFYYRLLYNENMEDLPPDIAKTMDPSMGEAPHPPVSPRLHFVGGPDPEIMGQAVSLMRSGMLDEARELFFQVAEDSEDYATARGCAALCLLMGGNPGQAKRECEALLKEYPDNIHTLTTYCEILSSQGLKEEAREVGRHLLSFTPEKTSEAYRLTLALCESGFHAEAAERFGALKEKLPCDADILFFHAAASYRSGDLDSAIGSLEEFTTLYPRRIIAQWYLEQIRKHRDGAGEEVPITYFYRMPKSVYCSVANALMGGDVPLNRLNEDGTSVPVEAMEPFDISMEDCFRIAFDEMDGRDAKLQYLAVKWAIKNGAYGLIREVLLDYHCDEMLKFSILHDLTMLNVEESYGTVFLCVYKEFFTHRINIGNYGATAFLTAFADVYSKYALLGEENEGKLCGAAEDVYDAVASGNGCKYFQCRAELGAAIYREARMEDSIRSIEEIAKLFDADLDILQKILNFLM